MNGSAKECKNKKDDKINKYIAKLFEIIRKINGKQKVQKRLMDKLFI